MDITLITEGTYPHNMGGVSVWCDQLLREMSEHTFELLSISATGTEKSTWEVPGNVATVGTIPLWGPTSRRRAGSELRKRFAPVLELFLSSLAIDSHGRGFAHSLRQLTEFARAGELGAALASKDAVEMLVGMSPECNERVDGEGPGN